MIEPRQLALRASPFCGTCPAKHLCSERYTDLGCSPDFEPVGDRVSYMVHPMAPDFLARFAEVNGFDLDISARPDHIPVLPGYIPHIRLQRQMGNLEGVPAVAVPLGCAESLARTARSRNCTARAVLGLCESQLLLVTGFAHDRFLERVWPIPRRGQLLEAIKSINPDAAIAWGYSVWHHTATGTITPRIEHLYNLKRSLKVYAELQELHIPAIPHMYWGLRADLHSWANWLDRNPSVTTIAMDLQTVDRDVDWDAVIRAVRYFRSILPRPVHCVFNGICRTDRLIQLHVAWPNSSVLNFGAWFAAAIPRKPLAGICPPVIVSDNHPQRGICHAAAKRYEHVLTVPTPALIHAGASWGHMEMAASSSPAIYGLYTHRMRATGQLPLFSDGLEGLYSRHDQECA